MGSVDNLETKPEYRLAAEYEFKTNKEGLQVRDYYHHVNPLDAVHAIVMQHHDLPERREGTVCTTVTKGSPHLSRLGKMAEGCSAKILKPFGIWAAATKLSPEQLVALESVRCHVFHARVDGENVFVAARLELRVDVPGSLTDEIFVHLESANMLDTLDYSCGVDHTVMYSIVEMCLSPAVAKCFHNVSHVTYQLVEDHPKVHLYAGESFIQEADRLVGMRHFSEALPTAVKNCKIHTALVSASARCVGTEMKAYKVYAAELDETRTLFADVIDKGIDDMLTTIVDKTSDGHEYDVIFKMAYWEDEDGAIGSKVMGDASYKAKTVDVGEVSE